MNRPKKTKRKFDDRQRDADRFMQAISQPPTRDEYERVMLKHRVLAREVVSQRAILDGVNKEIVGLRRTLAHETKLRQDMHTGVQAAKESLVQVRAIHVPWEQKGPLTDEVFCSGCGHNWPCPTLEAIREPEQLVITSLMEMKLELESSLEEQTKGAKPQS